MSQDEKVNILRSVLLDCMNKVDEKKRRMTIYFDRYEFPGMQRAEMVDRSIFGFLAPLTLFSRRKYTEKNRQAWVVDSVDQVMAEFYALKTECQSTLNALDNGKIREEEIEKVLIKIISRKEILFKPTIADLQMAELMGDLDKYGYEVDKKRGRIVKQSE